MQRPRLHEQKINIQAMLFVTPSPSARVEEDGRVATTSPPPHHECATYEPIALEITEHNFGKVQSGTRAAVQHAASTFILQGRYLWSSLQHIIVGPDCICPAVFSTYARTHTQRLAPIT